MTTHHGTIPAGWRNPRNAANLQLARGRLSISLRPLLPGKNRKESLTQSTEKLSLCDQVLVCTGDAFVEQYILK
jgi:hypothetical protein